MTFISLSFLWESTHPALPLCPKMHAMAEMAKNRQRAGDSNWTPKLASWRIAILAKMVKFLNIFPIQAINYIEVYR